MDRNINGNNNGQKEHSVQSIKNYLKQAAYNLVDLVPPYHTIVGELKRKEFSSDNSPYLIVGRERILVDPSVFDLLQEGEQLKIRSTRSKRAISIERLIITNNN